MKISHIENVNAILKWHTTQFKITLSKCSVLSDVADIGDTLRRIPTVQ